ncbi:MAG: anti-sigma factor [Candidatus Eremiobacteraeota bacterium]|nr:anti-sigma factor [Candidatus Eremiobacteraeota bacterium]
MSQHDEMLDLVAAHALGAVDANSPECDAVREHLRECAECQEEYRIASAAATALALSAAEEPPAGLRARTLQGLPAKRAVADIAAARARRNWFIPAAAAAAIVIAAGAWWMQQERTPAWKAVCLPAVSACRPGAAGQLQQLAADRLRLDVKGLRPPPVGKAYQAWVILPGLKPKPEPVVPIDAAGNGAVEIASAAPKGTIIALTLERAGGSTAPTTKPFLTATVE